MRATGKWSVKRAAINGAIAGAILILLSALQGQFPAGGTAAIALMMAGGALGGSILFVFFALVANLIVR
jgi:hypothetical protein